MADTYLIILSLIVFLPALSAIVLAFLPSDKPAVLRNFTLAVTVVVFALSMMALIDPFGMQSPTKFDTSVATMQSVFNVPWIPSFNIYYFMGIDGINLPLIVLSTFVCVMAAWAGWSITKQVKGYCILFLLLETGMIGVFMSLDFFLFYVFWEVMLLPMYFLIGVWGGPRREYAAIKFFLYTLVGSVLMLIAILMLYFASDIRGLSDVAFSGEQGKQKFSLADVHLGPDISGRIGYATTTPDEKRPHAAIAFLRTGAAAGEELAIDFATESSATATTAAYDAEKHTLTVSLAPEKSTAADVVAAINGSEGLKEVVVASLPHGVDKTDAVEPVDSLTIPAYAADVPLHTFNLLALAAIGQHTEQFDITYFGKSLQWWAFLLLFVGFIIKVPSVPLHTWLPDAHVEAPTPISMILAGVLLKMGGYGILRICYPICPDGGYDLAYFVCLLGVVSMVYGGFAALAQKDFKRMVAYSSVSHMGYVVLGLGVWSANMGTGYDPYYWNLGVSGAMFQMIGHGISSPGMFFMVGIIYDRVHHRNLEEFGGLFGKMPFYSSMAVGIFFAGLGLPGMCGFIGEVFVVLSVWKYSMAMAIVSAGVVVITAAYILWAIQRVYLGAEYKGPHADHLYEATLREKAIGVTLLVLCILFGIFPQQFVFQYTTPTITRQVNELAEWTKTVKEVRNPPAIANEEEQVAAATLDQ